MSTKFIPTNHAFATRMVHGLLVLAVLVQLLTSQFMRPPRGDNPGTFSFSIHEFSGLASMVVVLVFWALVMVRLRGTPAGLMVPWFLADRRAAFIADLKAHFVALTKLRLPEYRPDAPLAAGIHGLGLLLMTAMAGTGSIYFIGVQIGVQGGTVVKLAKELHEIMANLVWVYLIGHAGLAALHHFLGDADMREMWSANRETGTRPE